MKKMECRTLGDGMDNSLINLVESNLSTNNLKVNIHNTDDTVNLFRPIEPNGQSFHLIPKYVPKERKQPKYLIKKPKEPKFIPYEPYKGAVEPIIPRKTNVKGGKGSKNNIEIQELVSQISDIRVAELSKVTPETAGNEEPVISHKQWLKEKESYEMDIKNLRESNAMLENQLKFQAQVNSELKTLLVAAVGEDLETRVQHLTEDKLQLARALLKSADHLTSHQEQTEWLSGQCEVWRSKFLASSLMVEELARWKSGLTHRINELHEILKNLLGENRKIHSKSVRTYCFLNGISKKIHSDVYITEKLRECTVLELSNANLNMSKKISEHCDIDKDFCEQLYDEITRLPQSTRIENNALKVLKNPVTISSKQDVICNALMGTALSLSGEQMYLQHPSTQTTCCAHCTGEVKNL